MDKPRKVEFERLEDRVLPSTAGIVVSSESIAQLLADIGDSAVLAIGSYDAFRPATPGLSVVGGAVAGAGIAAYGLKKLKDKDKGRHDNGEQPASQDHQAEEDKPNA